MRVILDTNVFVSGVFFGGPPGRILQAWRDGLIRPVLSAEILDEYQRVGRIMRAEHLAVDLEPLLTLVAVHAELVDAPALTERICSDPDDDKFLACAAAAGVEVIVSGDKAVLQQSGWRRVLVIPPRKIPEGI